MEVKPERELRARQCTAVVAAPLALALALLRRDALVLGPVAVAVGGAHVEAVHRVHPVDLHGLTADLRGGAGAGVEVSLSGKPYVII